MNSISAHEKLLVFSLDYINRPASFVRLVRVLRLAELSTRCIYDKDFDLQWFRLGKEYRCDELSTAMDRLVYKKIVRKVSKSGYGLSAPLKVTLDPEWVYGLHAYLNSYYMKCHPRVLDKKEMELEMQLRGSSLNHGYLRKTSI